MISALAESSNHTPRKNRSRDFSVDSSTSRGKCSSFGGDNVEEKGPAPPRRLESCSEDDDGFFGEEDSRQEHTDIDNENDVQSTDTDSRFVGLTREGKARSFESWHRRHLRALYHKYPRVYSVALKIILPMYVLIAISFACGALIVHLEADVETEWNNEITAQHMGRITEIENLAEVYNNKLHSCIESFKILPDQLDENPVALMMNTCEIVQML